MAEFKPEGSNALEGLARARFSTLSAAELKLVRAAPEAGGGVAYCGPSHRDDRDNDPSRANSKEHGWGPDRQIRAEVIRWLCVDRRARDCVDPVGIQIHAAKVVGKLDLSRVAVPFRLLLRRCALTDDVRLEGTEIPALSFSGSWTRSLNAEGASVGGDVDLRDGFRAEGEVRLVNAKIAGNLECSGTFLNPRRKEVPGSGAALTADGITVKSSVFLGEGFHAEGEVRLPAAQIGGNLECGGGTLINPPRKEVSGSGTALFADGITVKGNVLLRAGFRAEGEVRLVNALIGGNLECDGGSFINPFGPGLDGSGTTLTADHANVGGSLMLRDGFRAEGIIRLPNARIGGDLETQKGIFSAAALVLENASSSSIVDDDQSWPGKGNLYLDGFLYGRISEKAPRDSQTRLKWLKLQPEKPFMPQPYLHLAKVLKEAGDDAGAVIVLEEMERNHRHQQDRTPTDRLTSWVFDESIGYGYDPGRAIWMILGLSALGWILYRRSYLAGNIVPTDKDAYESFKSEGRPPAHYLAFAPLVYSVENSLPLVKLGQADLWQPDPNPGPPARQALWTTRLGPQTAWPRLLRGLQKVLVFVGLQTPGDESKPRSRLCRWGTSPRVLRWFLWVQILLGWLLATLFVAGVTGIVHKE